MHTINPILVGYLAAVLQPTHARYTLPSPLLDGVSVAELLDRPNTVEQAAENGRATLARRDVQAGGSCGTQGNRGTCAAGLCCSETGVCGTANGACVAPGCQLSFGPACDANKSPAGADTSSVPRPQFGDIPYGVVINHCKVQGKVALTFDDGPYIYTTELLDLLARNGVKATFFIVGTNGGKGQINDPSSGYAAIVRRQFDDGHQVASHTWSHQDLTTLTPQQRRDQIIKNEIAISSLLGVIPTYFRPPYSSVNADVLNDLRTLGYHVTNYDIDTRDWEGDYNAARNTYSSILTQHSPDSSSWISIAHDIQDGTVHGFVQYMIDTARRLNYKLVTLGECLGDPPANWYRDPVTGQPRDPSSKSSPGKGTQPSSSPAASSSPAGSSSGSSSSSGTSKSPSAAASSSSSSSVSSKAVSSVSSAITPSAVSKPNFGAGTSTTTTAVPQNPGVSTPPQAPNSGAASLLGGSGSGRVVGALGSVVVLILASAGLHLFSYP